jgi:hypothetical protein
MSWRLSVVMSERHVLEHRIVTDASQDSNGLSVIKRGRCATTEAAKSVASQATELLECEIGITQLIAP